MPIQVTLPGTGVADCAERQDYKSLGKMEIALLTGCQDRPYAFGLAMAPVSSGICLEVIGGDAEDCPSFTRNLQSKVSQPGRGTARKGQFEREIVTLIAYYARLIRYATFSKSEADFSADTESKP